MSFLETTVFGFNLPGAEHPTEWPEPPSELETELPGCLDSLGAAWRLLSPREGLHDRPILCLGWSWMDGVSYRGIFSGAVVCVCEYHGVGRNGWCGLHLSTLQTGAGLDL